jgi:hypothetical protein
MISTMTYLSESLDHWQAGPYAMKAALGCAICSTTKKDEWFVQLRVPPEASLFGSVVLTSVFGIGREETIEKARQIAGVDEVVPWTIMPGFGTPGIVQGGDKRQGNLIAALALCEAACEKLREEISKHHDGI